jgi:hypothetical protein
MLWLAFRHALLEYDPSAESDHGRTTASVRGDRLQIMMGAIGRTLAFVTFAGGLFSQASCGGNGGVAEGGTCTSSVECSSGLLCDFGKTPHVCAKSETISHDMAVRVDGLVGDLAGRDLRAAD